MENDNSENKPDDSWLDESDEPENEEVNDKVESENNSWSNESDETENEEENEEDECFDLATLDVVSLEELTRRIGKLMHSVLRHAVRTVTSANANIFDVAVKTVVRSTIFEEAKVNNPVVRLIDTGLTMLFISEDDLGDLSIMAESRVIRFIAKLAIACYSQNCEKLLESIVVTSEQLFGNIRATVRQRVCSLVFYLLRESSEISDDFESLDEMSFDEQVLDGSFNEPAQQRHNRGGLPEGIVRQLALMLSSSVMDKSPAVRSAAVSAMSHIEHDWVFTDRNGNETTPNEVITRSMRDVDEDVRMVAVRCVHIVDKHDIDKALDFVELCSETRIRQLMAVRLASDVHLLSFSMEQRFRLINLLLKSNSVRMKSVIHQHLVVSWMNVASQQKAFATGPVDDSQSSMAMYSENFPSIILEYLDPMEDPGATAVVLKFAISRFMRRATGYTTNQIDFEMFLKSLLKMSDAQCERLGFMMRKSFSLIPVNDDPCEEGSLVDTYKRVFFSRYLVDVFCELNGSRDEGTALIRDGTLRFLLPPAVKFAPMIEKFCRQYMCEELSDEAGELIEVIAANCFHLLNTIIRENDDELERTIYRKMLESLLEAHSIYASSTFIEYLTTTIIDLCLENSSDVDDACDWACYAANKLLMTSEYGEVMEGDLESAVSEGRVSEEMLRRCTSMVFAMCMHEKVTRNSTLMKTLILFLVPILLSSRDDEIRIKGLELIASSALLDFEGSSAYLKLIRVQLVPHMADCVKAAAINGLVRLSIRHGFVEVAVSIYSGEEDESVECSKLMSELIEKNVMRMSGTGLVQAVRDVLSLLSHVRFCWPSILAFILSVVFNEEFKVYELQRFFKLFCKKSVVSTYSKCHLMVSWLRCAEQMDNARNKKTSLFDMSKFVCSVLSDYDVDNEQTSDAISFSVEGETCRRVLKMASNEPYVLYLRPLFSAISNYSFITAVPAGQLEEIRHTANIVCSLIDTHAAKPTQAAAKHFLSTIDRAIQQKKMQEEIIEEPKEMQIKTELPGEDGDEWSEPQRKRICLTSTLNIPTCNIEVKKEVFDIEESDEEDRDFLMTPQQWARRKRRNTSIIRLGKKIRRVVLEQDNETQL